MTNTQRPADTRSAVQCYRWADEVRAEGRDPDREQAIALARTEAAERADYQRYEDAEQAAYLAEWRKTHPQRKTTRRDVLGLLFVLTLVALVLAGPVLWKWIYPW